VRLDGPVTFRTWKTGTADLGVRGLEIGRVRYDAFFLFDKAAGLQVVKIRPADGGGTMGDFRTWTVNCPQNTDRLRIGIVNLNAP